ncbi:MAG: hypothetical protein ACOC6B_02420 [Thermodesulfobacteriota bacterium]
MGVFQFTGNISGEESNKDCKKIAGIWDVNYAGTSCKGNNEKGTLVLSIKEDCSFNVEKKGLFPFLTSLFFSGKSLRLKNNHIEAAIDIRFDNCGDIILRGEIKKPEKGNQITGEYQYPTRGEGCFKGIRKHPAGNE